MQNGEAMKAVRDSQVYRDRAEKYKLEVHQLKKLVRELEGYRQEYDEIKEREDTRNREDAQHTEKRERELQRLRVSIRGHISEVGNGDHQTIFS
jgi:hypothetical protein